MTVEEALQAFSMIEGLYNHTPESADQVAHLAQQLVTDPSNFWEMFFTTLDSDSPTRQLAQQLIGNGRITADSTFADLREILAEENSGRGYDAQ